MTPTEGDVIFARYALSPNDLGYCGPHTDLLHAVASCDPERAQGSEPILTEVARKFSGVWSYLHVLEQVTGLPAMSHELVRQYWTGADIEIDRDAFARGLLDYIRPQAGAYWSHLNESLLDEVRPNHAFHVLGVYPWSRLLHTGAPQPLHVLNSCRIRIGTVVSVSGTRAVVATENLTYDGALDIVEADDEVEIVQPTDVAVGDTVALHWSQIIDRLTAAQADLLAAQNSEQIELTNRRL